MKEKTPVVKINPDIEVMNPEDFEPPELYVVVEEPIGQKYCSHEQIRIYPHHRIIKCRACQAVIEPFDYILRAGRLENNFLSYMKYLKIKMDRMIKEEEAVDKLYRKIQRDKLKR